MSSWRETSLLTPSQGVWQIFLAVGSGGLGPERAVPSAQVGAGAAGGGLGTPIRNTASVLKGRFGAVLGTALSGRLHADRNTQASGRCATSDLGWWNGPFRAKIDRQKDFPDPS